MKILLLTTPRTGSTYTLELYAKAFPDYKIANEPWDIKRIDPNFHHNNYTNIIVKNHVRDLLLTYPTYFYNILNDFDQIIRINRTNIVEQTISLALAKSTKRYVNDGCKHHPVNINYELISNSYYNIIGGNAALDLIKVNSIIEYESLTLNPIEDAKLLGLNITDSKLQNVKSFPKKEEIINYDQCVGWVNDSIRNQVKRERNLKYENIDNGFTRVR